MICTTLSLPDIPSHIHNTSCCFFLCSIRFLRNYRALRLACAGSYASAPAPTLWQQLERSSSFFEIHTALVTDCYQLFLLRGSHVVVSFRWGKSVRTAAVLAFWQKMLSRSSSRFTLSHSGFGSLPNVLFTRVADSRLSTSRLLPRGRL